jgi:hypothetical protein
LPPPEFDPRNVKVRNVFAIPIELSRHKPTGYKHDMSKKVISGFRHEIDENSGVLSYHAASNGNFFLLTFRDNISVTSLGVKNPKGLRLFTY